MPYVEGDWREVKTDPPPSEGRVLFWSKRSGREIGVYYGGGQFETDDHRCYRRVPLWMPLPPIPEGR